jgi:hypothetical protein
MRTGRGFRRTDFPRLMRTAIPRTNAEAQHSANASSCLVRHSMRVCPRSTPAISSKSPINCGRQSTRVRSRTVTTWVKDDDGVRVKAEGRVR